MKATFIVADNVISPLGWTAGENFGALLNGQSGIRLLETSEYSPTPIWASVIDGQAVDERASQAGFSPAGWTKLERLALLSISDALAQTDIDLKSPETAFIFSTTKGNIGLLDGTNASMPDLLLHKTAEKIASAFGHKGLPIVVAHACISGLAAIIAGKRLLEIGMYKHAVITGVDLVSRFVVSGFQSFQALSDEPCRPFDKHRKGLNLGEACGTALLSIDPKYAKGKQPIRVVAGSTSNDANHISGPSRSGEELSQAINQVLAGAKSVGFISAHGTATAYNDEMEAKAFALSGLENVPLNSMKGNFGHTLGAAGLVESIICIESLRQDTIIPSLGYEEHGVSQPVKVNKHIVKKHLTNCLKTASGFGGCNAAVVFEK
jgi:3-oxoacyl-[acyl-carrier-protein] synthase-1